ncbi:MAG: hypothetical protein PHH11_11885 [Methylomonas sp.]|nr:hypothetical protein [Methylomonas sp.]
MKTYKVVLCCIVLMINPIIAIAVSDSDRLFDYAEQNFPQYFSPPGAAATFPMNGYLVRHYPATNNYIGTLGDDVYVYGNVFGGLVKVGQISDFISIDMPSQPKTIAFVVEPSIATAINKNLTNFIEEVKRDTGASTVIIDSPAEPDVLKETLFNVPNLWGAYFIGAIPILKEHIKTGNIDIYNVSDNYYRSHYCPYGSITAQSFNMFVVEAQSDFSILSVCESDIWLARLKGTTSTKEVDEINRYLQTNVVERRNVDGYTNNMTFIAATREKMFDSGFADLFNNHPLFASTQIFAPELPTASERRDAIVDCLQSSETICKINAHGAPDRVVINGVTLGDDIWFTSNDTEPLNISSKIVELESCSTGNFSVENFLAGKILFNNKTLLVKANPMDTFYTNDGLSREANGMYYALGSGRSVADVYTRMQQGEPPHFFGDPTILLKERKLLADRPMLVIENRRYHEPFTYNVTAESTSGATVEKVLTIYNAGKSDLVLNGWAIGSFHTVDDRVPDCAVCQIAFQLNPPLNGFETKIKVLAGKSASLRFVFDPTPPSGQIQKGEHATKFRFSTNDPEIGAFDIPFMITVR